jgi:type I restriction enzyme S subunit
MLHSSHRLNTLSSGTTISYLSREAFEEFPVVIPSLEEQSRIAGFLMALDAKVAGVAQAVAAAQKWKKGLLQQMFV